MELRKLVKDILTERDGESYCPIRVFAAALSTPTILLFIAGCIEKLIHGTLSLQDMATSFATMTGGFAALGVGVAAKAFTDSK